MSNTSASTLEERQIRRRLEREKREKELLSSQEDLSNISVMNEFGSFLNDSTIKNICLPLPQISTTNNKFRLNARKKEENQSNKRIFTFSPSTWKLAINSGYPSPKHHNIHRILEKMTEKKISPLIENPFKEQNSNFSSETSTFGSTKKGIVWTFPSEEILDTLKNSAAMGSYQCISKESRRNHFSENKATEEREQNCLDSEPKKNAKEFEPNVFKKTFNSSFEKDQIESEKRKKNDFSVNISREKLKKIYEKYKNHKDIEVLKRLLDNVDCDEITTKRSWDETMKSEEVIELSESTKENETLVLNKEFLEIEEKTNKKIKGQKKRIKMETYLQREGDKNKEELSRDYRTENSSENNTSTRKIETSNILTQDYTKPKDNSLIESSDRYSTIARDFKHDADKCKDLKTKFKLYFYSLLYFMMQGYATEAESDVDGEEITAGKKNALQLYESSKVLLDYLNKTLLEKIPDLLNVNALRSLLYKVNSVMEYRIGVIKSFFIRKGLYCLTELKKYISSHTQSLPVTETINIPLDVVNITATFLKEANNFLNGFHFWSKSEKIVPKDFFSDINDGKNPIQMLSPLIDVTEYCLRAINFIMEKEKSI